MVQFQTAGPGPPKIGNFGPVSLRSAQLKLKLRFDHWAQLVVPLILFLGLTVLDAICPRLDVPPGTIITLGEVTFSFWIAWYLRKKLPPQYRFYLLIPIGLGIGDLMYALNHYILKIVYSDALRPLIYAVPYVVAMTTTLVLLIVVSKRVKDSNKVIIISSLSSLLLLALNFKLIIYPSLFANPKILPATVATLAVIFSVLESGIVGFCATLLTVCASAPLQFIFFGFLTMNISDIAIRYQSVYSNYVGISIFENGWFFGLTLLIIGVGLLLKMTDAQARLNFAKFLKIHSIKTMTAGFMLLGLAGVWLTLTYFYGGLNSPSQVSMSLLIMLGIFYFAIFSSNVVDKSLSQITFNISNQHSLLRTYFPKSLPEEIGHVVEHFQTLNSEIWDQRNHAIKLSSTMAHNIKIPIFSLSAAKDSISAHTEKGCTCCTSLKYDLDLLDTSSEEIVKIADHIGLRSFSWTPTA